MTRFDSTCIDLEFIVCGGYETYFFVNGNWDYVVLFLILKIDFLKINALAVP